MNKLLIVAALSLCGFAAHAQSSSTLASDVKVDTTSGAAATNQGNEQNITFTSPERSISDQNVDYSGSYKIRNTPSVSGPNLTTSNDTCMGSTSGSANVPGVGIGFGTTWTDTHCQNLKMSRELWNKGLKAASLAVDCETPVARRAIEMTGMKCPQSMTVEERRASFGPMASAEGAVASPVAANSSQQMTATTNSTAMSCSAYSGNDPIARKRVCGF